MRLRDYQEAALDALLNQFHWETGAHPLMVLPTGTGKSLVIAELCRRVATMFPYEKIMIISHVKEILEQDMEKIVAKLS